MHSEDEIGGNEVEDESVNGTGMAIHMITDVHSSGILSIKEQENILTIQNSNDHINATAEVPNEGDINIIDPGGTIQIVDCNVLKETENADKKQEKTVQDLAGSTIPLKTVQELARITVPLNNTQLLPNEQADKAAEHINQAYDIVTSKEDMEAHDQVDHAEQKGRDIDEESTAQNFLNVAKKGDLSPRLIEIVKSATKGRKKQSKETSTVPASGVQTRRTQSKSQNL